MHMYNESTRLRQDDARWLDATRCCALFAVLALQFLVTTTSISVSFAPPPTQIQSLDEIARSRKSHCAGQVQAQESLNLREPRSPTFKSYAPDCDASQRLQPIALRQSTFTPESPLPPRPLLTLLEDYTTFTVPPSTPSTCPRALTAFSQAHAAGPWRLVLVRCCHTVLVRYVFAVRCAPCAGRRYDVQPPISPTDGEWDDKDERACGARRHHYMCTV
ncbi:hypothetical protein DFH06DRAFT_1343646 [Mycena polygramma]|nr:hypothetical protein DFH06DRAFT_1343646 [Mycena polygramma]